MVAWRDQIFLIRQKTFLIPRPSCKYGPQHVLHGPRVSPLAPVQATTCTDTSSWDFMDGLACLSESPFSPQVMSQLYPCEFPHLSTLNLTPMNILEELCKYRAWLLFPSNELSYYCCLIFMFNVWIIYHLVFKSPLLGFKENPGDDNCCGVIPTWLCSAPLFPYCAFLKADSTFSFHTACRTFCSVTQHWGLLWRPRL